MHHDPVRELPAAFESVCLVRCVDVARLPGRRRPGWLATTPPAGPAVTEFDERDAAARLVELLTDLGHPASREVRTGGGRRRYLVHRVLVAEPERVAAERTMAAAWRQGRLALLRTEALGSSSPRHQRRVALAGAAWRAALLAGGRRSRADLLWVRLADQEMAAVLVRAARLMDVPAEVTRRPGCLVVTVPAAAAQVLDTAERGTGIRPRCSSSGSSGPAANASIRRRSPDVPAFGRSTAGIPSA